MCADVGDCETTQGKNVPPVALDSRRLDEAGSITISGTVAPYASLLYEISILYSSAVHVRLSPLGTATRRSRSKLLLSMNVGPVNSIDSFTTRQTQAINGVLQIEVGNCGDCVAVGDFFDSSQCRAVVLIAVTNDDCDTEGFSLVLESTRCTACTGVTWACSETQTCYPERRTGTCDCRDGYVLSNSRCERVVSINPNDFLQTSVGFGDNYYRALVPSDHSLSVQIDYSSTGSVTSEAMSPLVLYFKANELPLSSLDGVDRGKPLRIHSDRACAVNSTTFWAYLSVFNPNLMDVSTRFLVQTAPCSSKQRCDALISGVCITKLQPAADRPSESVLEASAPLDYASGAVLFQLDLPLNARVSLEIIPQLSQVGAVMNTTRLTGVVITRELPQTSPQYVPDSHTIILQTATTSGMFRASWEDCEATQVLPSVCPARAHLIVTLTNLLCGKAEFEHFHSLWATRA